MGLSSSKQKTTANATEQREEHSTGTQTPMTPEWLEAAARDYVDRVGEFAALDPSAMVAGAAPLQEQAWSGAARLGGWEQPLGDAISIASRVGEGGPNLAGPAAASWSPASVAFQGYSPAQVGETPGAEPVRVGATERAESASLLDGFDAYRSPYIDQVVNLSLAAQRGAADRQAARLKAEGAKSGAFGGSRFALAEAQLASNAAQDEALLAAQLHDQAFRQAADLSQNDASARQRASEFNAGESNQAAIVQAGLTAQESQNRLTDTRERDLKQADLESEAQRQTAEASNAAEATNAAAQNHASEAAFEAEQRRSIFNAGQSDHADNRHLATAQLLAAIAAGQAGAQRGDLQMLSDLGAQQRLIDQSQLLAPFAQLQSIGQLSGMTPYQILVGSRSTQDRTGESTSSSNSVTRQTPSIFDNLLAVARTAAPFF